MDDLNATLGAILSDPNKIEQLRQVAQSLGLGAPQGGTPPAGSSGQNATSQGTGGGFDPAAISAILQNFQKMSSGTSSTTGAAANPAPGGGADLGMLSKLAGIMGTFNQSDKNVDLLRALQPHFSATRASRIDDAVRIMQLMRIWPSVRESGLLGGLGNLFSGGGKK